MSADRIRVLCIFGSRPEAIKFAPVISAMNKWPTHFESVICLTGEDEGVRQVLKVFDLQEDHQIAACASANELDAVTCHILGELRDVLIAADPHVALVQGDTETTFAGALACFYRGIPVGHIEAGVRSQSKFSPFPEEMNRRLSDCLCDLHFAPTEQNRQQLLAEGCLDESVVVSGNPVIDALSMIVPHIRTNEEGFRVLESVGDSRIILFTCHRRASYGDDLEEICEMLDKIVAERSDVVVACPLHDELRDRVEMTIGGDKRFRLLQPLSYVAFVGLMERSHIVLTDSDGIQEEAISLDKPVLLLREHTERPEAIECGGVKLVGTSTEDIRNEALRLLDEPQAYYEMAESANPFGDGKAGIRIVNSLYRRYADK